ncbi:ceramidase domain-containing protein [Herpetosiphon gulosus]|uniref:Ceramidase n=1 Tax=Herpetosiphon gulosus TaxID=1973496 RepID=A0ABP9X7P7_9CHLR
MFKLKFIKYPLIAFSLFCLMLAFINTIDYTWNGWKSATCFPSSCFCESIRDSIIRQPVNTWSSLSFVLSGLIVIRFGFTDRLENKNKNFITKYIGFPILFGIALIIIGIGSTFYHASLTFIGQFMDVFGMYLIATFMIIYVISRKINKIKIMLIAYVLSNILLALLLVFIPELRRYAFAIIIVIGLAMETLYIKKSDSYINTRYIKIAITSMAIAFAIWITDITKIICSPYSIYQGHAIWHLLGALSSLYLYLYYRSEERKM